jgi:aryl-alcohol dehydrogenase-like predicted oxidoreductase
VRVIGASNFSAARLTEALDTSARLGLPRYECLQPLYNLYERSEFEGALEQVCREHALAVIPYRGLASGFLTGKYRSEKDFGKSPRGHNMGKYLNPRGERILSALDQVALHHGATPTQVALAWLMTRPGITAPIASATRLEQLDDLVAATRLRLDPTDIEKLDRAGAETQPSPGER